MHQTCLLIRTNHKSRNMLNSYFLLHQLDEFRFNRFCPNLVTFGAEILFFFVFIAIYVIVYSIAVGSFELYAALLWQGNNPRLSVTTFYNPCRM